MISISLLSTLKEKAFNRKFIINIDEFMIVVMYL